MALITRLVATGDRSKKVKVYLDGKYAFSLEADLALEAGLRTSQELSQSKIDRLDHANHLKKALAAAGCLLSFRPRSEHELRQKLTQRGFDAVIISESIEYLKEHKQVDDAAFARYWAENRTAFNPRSQRLLQLELRQKGVTADVAEETSSEIDDEAGAYAAGAKRVSRLEMSDYEDFRHRLGEYLRRRGFGYDVINRSVKRLWDEHAHKE